MSPREETGERLSEKRFRAVGWLMQRITGLGLVLFLGLHFLLQHLPNGFLATAEEYNRMLQQGEVLMQQESQSPKGAWAPKEALPGEHVITYSKVVERLQSPLWKVIDISLLLLALSHGMQGLSKVLGDYVARVRLRRTLVALGWIAAALLAWEGIRVILAAGMNIG